MYTIVFSEGAKRDLRGYDGTVYSKRITKEHRLVYKIYEDVVEVLFSQRLVITGSHLPAFYGNFCEYCGK